MKIEQFVVCFFTAVSLLTPYSVQAGNLSFEVQKSSILLKPFPEKLFSSDTIQLVSYPVAPSDSDIYVWNDPLREKKHPWRAAFEVFGLNMLVWGFDRYAMDADFAKISFRTIEHNIKHGFVWDNDQFSTNLFAHPYHGNLYYNLARSNGMDFWGSIPYAIGGSLMWEVAMENEPPSINDFIATPIGGIALGEVTFRLSNLFLNDSKRGFNRFIREFAGTLIDPMQGLNRIFSGDAWKVRSKYYKYHDFNAIPVHFILGISDRYLADDNYLFRGYNMMHIDFDVKYGDPLDENLSKPYDCFYFHAGINIGSSQPLIGDVSLVAKIVGRKYEPLPGHRMMVGLFQHFDFYDSKPVINDTELPPFKIAEAAAFGLGMIYELPAKNERVKIRQATHINAILLGGSISDHYKVVDRNYNMGSGFSLKGRTEIRFSNYANFLLNVQFYQIYTWIGKHPDELIGDPVYYNVQGDKSFANLTIINPAFSVYLMKNLKFRADMTYYFRNTNYDYYEDVNFQTFETKFGLVYEF